MNILRIAFKKSPSETAKIMAKIYIEDQNISKLEKTYKKKKLLKKNI